MTKTLKFIRLITIIPLIYFFIFICVSNIFAGNQAWTTGGPTNGREMDLAIGKNNIYASGYNGVWKSEDKGLSWVEKNNGIPTSYDVNNIEVDLNNDNVVFAGTWNQGLYKSENGGNSWVKVNSFPGNFIRKLKIDPKNGNVIYVGTGSDTQPGTIYKTIDGGDTWQKLNLGAEGIIAYITIEPADNQTITAGIIGGTKPGRYKSEDGGITWIRFSSDTIDFPDYPTPNPQVYYKIVNSKLYISLDKGISWSPTNDNGLPSNFQIRYLTIDHADANRIFLFSIQSGVYESKDAGYTWNPIGSFSLSSFQDLYIDKNNPATIYITTNGNGVWQYTLAEITPTPTPTPTLAPSPTPTPTPLQPLILLPGLGASWNHENMILGIEKSQSDWYMTPGIKVYDGLIETLKNAGYKTGGEDKNLFIFNYNWTKPVNLISEDLKTYIENVVKPNSGTKIDLVGHSLGGLVARTYVQNNQDNPIDQLLTLGSPHQGIPSIYYLWEGGNLNKALSGWQRISAGLLVHLKKSGFSTTMETLRSVAPGLKDLLPTFNYLKQDSNNKPLELKEMDQKNDWLIVLNTSPPVHLLSILNAFVGFIPNNSTLRWIQVENPGWLDNILGLWKDGKPLNEEKAAGDGTVLVESGFLDGATITNLENINHTDLVTSITGQQKIMEVLGLTPSLISTISTNINYEPALVFLIASPATLSIIGPNGNPAGYGDGKLIIVSDAQEGEYQIKVNGTGQGEYQLHIGQIINNKDIWTTTSGFINSGEEIIHEVNFNISSPLENPLVDQTGEEYIKSARSKLFNLKNKVNQENLNKAVKRTILTQLNQIIRLLDKGKIENSVVSLYHLHHQINFWQLNEKLDENNSRYLKNKIQEIIEDLEKTYVIIETNKGAFYNPHRLVQEIKLAQKFFNEMENKLQKLGKKGLVNTDYGTLYLLAQEKLEKAKTSTSFEAHINALGAQFLSQELLFLK